MQKNCLLVFGYTVVLIMVQFSNMDEIGHLHDDVIWLQLPESIFFMLSYLNLLVPLSFKKQ